MTWEIANFRQQIGNLGGHVAARREKHRDIADREEPARSISARQQEQPASIQGLDPARLRLGGRGQSNLPSAGGARAEVMFHRAWRQGPCRQHGPLRRCIIPVLSGGRGIREPIKKYLFRDNHCRVREHGSVGFPPGDRPPANSRQFDKQVVSLEDIQQKFLRGFTEHYGGESRPRCRLGSDAKLRLSEQMTTAAGCHAVSSDEDSLPHSSYRTLRKCSRSCFSSGA